MKKLYYSILLILFSLGSRAQIPPKAIYLCYNKTVHMVFASKVTYIDVGISDILWKMEGRMAKFATKVDHFPETSLVIKTGDDRIYSFLLRYADNSDTLIYSIPPSEGMLLNKNTVKHELTEEKDSITDVVQENDTLSRACKEIIKKEMSIRNVDDVEKDVYVSLNNIYVYQDKLFFHFKVFNWSNINYDVDCFDMTLSDKKRLKVSTIQPIVVSPIYTYHKFDRLPAQQMKDIVIVTNKFTVADKKKLTFELKEKDGGRNFSFVIDKNLIYKAPALSFK